MIDYESACVVLFVEFFCLSADYKHEYQIKIGRKRGADAGTLCSEKQKDKG
jgi:hypothetical protein